MTAAELVRTDNINNGIPETTELSVLDDEVGLPLLFSIDGMLLRWLLKPESLQICSSAVRMVVLPSARSVLQASFLLPAASCRCVDVITVHVNDVLIARADKLRRGSLLQLGNRHTKVLAKQRRPRSLGP